MTMISNSCVAGAVENAQVQTEEVAPSPALFVATNLESWETTNPSIYARDVTSDALCFRRLDPAYYAWLRHKMSLVKKATLAGQLSPASFSDLKARFVRVHDWAMKNLDQAALQHAMNNLDAQAYLPPIPWKSGDLDEQEAKTVPVEPKPSHLCPAAGDFNFTHSVSPEAVAKVDAIKDQALSLDWTEPSLYQNRGRFAFPYGEDYGLVCSLDGDRRIGEVTRQSIEIIVPGPREGRLRFYNRHVDQPWIKRPGENTP